MPRCHDGFCASALVICILSLKWNTKKIKILFTGYLHSESEVKKEKVQILFTGYLHSKSEVKYKKNQNIIHWTSALWVFRPLVGVKRGQTITIVAEELISNKEVISSSFFGIFQEVILSCPMTCNCVVVCQNHGHKIEIQKNILSSEDIRRQLFCECNCLRFWNKEKVRISHNRTNSTKQPRKWFS